MRVSFHYSFRNARRPHSLPSTEEHVTEQRARAPRPPPCAAMRPRGGAGARRQDACRLSAGISVQKQFMSTALKLPELKHLNNNTCYMLLLTKKRMLSVYKRGQRGPVLSLTGCVRSQG